MREPVCSKNAIPIRLTDERWTHITEEHCELAGMRLDVLETIVFPDNIYAGNDGELLAVRLLIVHKYLVVIYRESEDDGFIITAFLTSKKRNFHRRRQVWPS